MAVFAGLVYRHARVKKRILVSGMDHHLAKPVDPDDLDRLMCLQAKTVKIVREDSY